MNMPGPADLHGLEEERLLGVTRRHFFRRCGVGVGAMALHNLLQSDWATLHTCRRSTPTQPMSARTPQFAPKAKNIIFLFMAGGPSQLELFEDKPKLTELTGQKPPQSLMQGRRFAFLKGHLRPCLAPRENSIATASAACR
jgi:hypothetical protein